MTACKGMIVFDLDGTLIDSRGDLARTVNQMRRHFELTPLSLETVISYVGDGMRKLLERSLAGTGVEAADAEDVMRTCYAEHLLGETTLYPGVREGLKQLRDGGWILNLFSNKPDPFCRTILHGFQLDELFSEISGGSADHPMKPDPTVILEMMKQAGTNREKTWILGDNHTDLEAGERAGIHTAFAGWGFGKANGKKYEMRPKTFTIFTGEML